jgi:glycosyltransferase involved in cell wall biosynthesis
MPVPLRVLAFAQYPDTQPSTRFRLAQFVGPLRASGVEMTIHPFLPDDGYRKARRPGLRALPHVLAGFRDLAAAVASSRAFDVVVVQRNLAPFMDRHFLERLQRSGVPVVYDFDDAIYLELVGGRRWLEALRAPRETARAFCRAAQVILAGNDHLADFARKAAGARRAHRVKVLPSVIDTDRFTPAPSVRERPPTLGWVGSDTTLPYLEAMTPVLEELHRRSPFRLVVASGHQRPDLGGLPFDFVSWSAEGEVDVFHELDVGLYPLDDTPWTRGKCGFKAIQYMACGIPCVASPVGPLEHIVRHGETGFHARAAEEWVERCHALLIDPELRSRLGRAGRRTVVDHYSVHAALPILSDSLRDAAGQRPSPHGGPR